MNTNSEALFELIAAALKLNQVGGQNLTNEMIVEYRILYDNVLNSMEGSE